jgi:hypothetical protein
MQVTRERPWTKGFGRLICIGLFTWLLLLGGMGVSEAMDSALQVSPLLHDFGAVKRLGGQVHTSFIVHVEGDTAIKIRRIWTS